MKKKYVPDLSRQMASCEANYLRLIKLMPDMDKCDERFFHVLWHHHRATVELSVEERFAYTTTIKVQQRYDRLEHDESSQSSASDSEQNYSQHAWINMPALIVRIYHDARMAEVICQQRRQLKGCYPYPNKQMHHPDEKAQLNQYLGEWLTQCLAHGHSSDQLAIA
ncbi:DUF1249 domain-containing protein [Motiliproteus sp. MSK22-1]|uniref:DUF1249 domain-containing protein n=1 Tax=Motiliproteus sp. MSK22-1 TaxID=1897630 RepID=UPI0009776322|nr:DUF1249 domain-containing protein [Motiliproteus sp. MSK22-1]OMH38328.1 hypothetical protein BGP75_08795 [Motiliproteus sp. MSK22-1]